MNGKKIDLRNTGAEPSGWADPEQGKLRTILREIVFTEEELGSLEATKYRYAKGIFLLIEDREIVVEPLWDFSQPDPDDPSI